MYVKNTQNKGKSIFFRFRNIDILFCKHFDHVCKSGTTGTLSNRRFKKDIGNFLNFKKVPQFTAELSENQKVPKFDHFKIIFRPYSI